ncbi:MAG: hypothetical protein AB7Q69_04895 [Gemmatimonadales bacterium]
MLKTAHAVILAVLLGGVVGCEGLLKGSTGVMPGAELASVIITPAAVNVTIGSEITFAAYGLTTAGDSVDVALNWSSDGGVLGNNGSFTATKPGTYSIVGQAVQSPFPADTSVVTVVVPPPTLDSIAVSPSATTIAPGGTRQFAADAFYSDSSMAPANVAWTATGGTIANDGTYTAGNTAGTFEVVATAIPAGPSDTAVVTIGTQAAVLQQVRLSPDSAQVAAGGQVSFQTRGRYSDGSQGPISVSYTVTAGSITPAGLYTAPQTAGTYRVIAREAASGLADTSRVNVTSSPLASIVISPATVSLQFGQTQQFSAVGILGNGSQTPITASYTTTGGTVTTGGFFTAGNAPGSFLVIATSGVLKDTAVVTVSPPPAVITGLSLLPPTSSLLPGANQNFGAFLVYSDGTTQQTTPTYAVTGGTITTNGIYTAPQVSGTYRVIATAPVGGYKDTSIVTVNAPATLTSVFITPSSVTLGVGQTAAFIAQGRLSDGSVSSVSVNWSTTTGSISSSGLLTAGSTVGQFRVIARLANGTLADTSDVFVSGTPPSGSNEPAGYVPFAIHRLSDIPVFGRAVGGVLGSWYAYPQGNSRLTIVSVPSAPQSPDSVIQTRFQTGLQAGTAPVDWGGWDIAGSGAAGQKSKMYISMWVRIVGPDYENQASGTKVGFIAFGRPPSSGSNEGTFWLDNGSGSQRVQSSFKMQFREQGIPQPNGQVTRNLTQNLTGASLMTAGSWHRWEAVLILNTAGQANGIFKMWIDGTPVMDYSDVTYVTSAYNNGFNLFKWNPTWGGSGGNRTRDDLIQIDHVYISGLP